MTEIDYVRLPEGWRLDPRVTEHMPEIGVWWVVLSDGTRTAWNGDRNLICPVCQGDKEKMPDCSACKGRGKTDNIPYCDRPWDEVAPNLWLGGHDCQPAGAPPLGDCCPGSTFDMVVSLYQRRIRDFATGQSEPDPLYEPAPGVNHMHYRMSDSDLDAEHHNALDEMAMHVIEALDRGEKVLIRCQAGINRAALLTGLVMLQLGWSADDAIARMREVRSPFVLFNTSFVQHLHEVEKRQG